MRLFWMGLKMFLSSFMLRGKLNFSFFVSLIKFSLKVSFLVRS